MFWFYTSEHEVKYVYIKFVLDGKIRKNKLVVSTLQTFRKPKIQVSFLNFQEPNKNVKYQIRILKKACK